MNTHFNYVCEQFKTRFDINKIVVDLENKIIQTHKEIELLEKEYDNLNQNIPSNFDLTKKITEKRRKLKDLEEHLIFLNSHQKYKLASIR